MFAKITRHRRGTAIRRAFLRRTAAPFLGLTVAMTAAGAVACEYPDDYVIRRVDMTVDYTATMECVRSFEEETEKLVEEATEQLEETREAYEKAKPGSYRRRGRRVAANLARIRLREAEQQIASIRSTMDVVHARTRGYRMLSQIPPPPEHRKFKFIRPPGAVPPVPDPE